MNNDQNLPKICVFLLGFWADSTIFDIVFQMFNVLLLEMSELWSLMCQIQKFIINVFVHNFVQFPNVPQTVISLFALLVTSKLVFSSLCCQIKNLQFQCHSLQLWYDALMLYIFTKLLLPFNWEFQFLHKSQSPSSLLVVRRKSTSWSWAFSTNVYETNKNILHIENKDEQFCSTEWSESNYEKNLDLFKPN